MIAPLTPEQIEWQPVLCLVEWFLAPLAMYLLLFKWRDRLNILHMPWADLVALFVLADIALAINYEQVPHNFSWLRTSKDPIAADWRHWLGLAVAGVWLCRILVKSLENRIRLIAIDDVTVGWPHPPRSGAIPLPKREAIHSRKWTRFSLLWSASVALAALFIAANFAMIGTRSPAYPFVPADLLLQIHLAVVALTAFLGGMFLCALFVITGYCRVY